VISLIHLKLFEMVEDDEIVFEPLKNDSNIKKIQFFPKEDFDGDKNILLVFENVEGDITDTSSLW